MPESFEPRYDHTSEEEKIYGLWEKSGYFNPDKCTKDGVAKKDAEPFSIVLPPPNVTGNLHMGHAAMLVIEDILVRIARMQGKRTVWIPGTDHAAIATQSKVESELYKKEKKTRYDLGREEFLSRVEEFAQKSRDTIVHQIKRMGASVDWSREAYTLDDKRSEAVRTAFKTMYDAGLIYRGARIVHWDPNLQTTVSDDEIEWIEEKTPLYYLQYGPFEIATARPETKFGDKYVVMHPADTRYKKYKEGQQINLEWINGPITATIIKDEAIDMAFGTGVMTITPWHDAADFDIAERHKLDKEQIIDEQGLLLPIAGEFAGMHIKKARPLIVEKLQAKGLVVKVDEHYVHHVATNSRGGGVIEPQIKEQWFVDVNKKFSRGGETMSLKDLMRRPIERGEIKIIPERFEKIYFHWIDNLRDWCISRQIWFGHRIPVWYHEPRCVPRKGHEKDVVRCPQIVIAEKKPACEFCDAQFVQDPDTLDTWFSSGLWTFSTLGWPETTNDLKTYHPTNVLETGYDILFFWVARMILMSEYLLGEAPFRTVYLHGLVRDEQGRKMSKSIGNVIDPLDMIEKYGADATRLSLVIGAAPGNDIKLSEDKVRGYRNFATKIWNAARFIAMHKPKKASGFKFQVSRDDQKLLDELAAVQAQVTKHIENFELHLAGETLYHYFWHTFADKIIEETKPRLKNGNEKEQAAAYHLLETILIECLVMLHPFAPFVTEAVYQKFLPAEALAKEGRPGELLMVKQW